MNYRWVVKRIVRSSLHRAFGIVPQTDYYLVSYPKSGRTWLRMMIGTAISKDLRLSVPDPTDFSMMYHHSWSVPIMKATHDDDAHVKTTAEIKFNTETYRNSRVILLVRDPRDVIVSLFFHWRFRSRNRHPLMPIFETPDDLMRSERGGLDGLIKFYNVWAENHQVPKNLLIVSYEDMSKDPKVELQRCLSFLGFDVSDKNLNLTLELSRFDRMREFEQAGTISPRLTPGDHANPDSYKTRRGIVGGYADYLAADAISEMNLKIGEKLSPFFSRYRSPD